MENVQRRRRIADVERCLSRRSFYFSFFPLLWSTVGLIRWEMKRRPSCLRVIPRGTHFSSFSPVTVFSFDFSANSPAVTRCSEFWSTFSSGAPRRFLPRDFSTNTIYLLVSPLHKLYCPARWSFETRTVKKKKKKNSADCFVIYFPIDFEVDRSGCRNSREHNQKDTEASSRNATKIVPRSNSACTSNHVAALT